MPPGSRHGIYLSGECVFTEDGLLVYLIVQGVTSPGDLPFPLNGYTATAYENGRNLGKQDSRRPEWKPGSV